MNFLIIGLGSMGKRRIRCLKYLGIKNIYGYDINPKRINEAKSKYKISILKKKEYRKLLKKKYFTAVIISTDPLYHYKYIKESISYNTSCFCEASVTNLNKMLKLKNILLNKKLIFAPSCTAKYYPLPKLMKKNYKKVGKPLFMKYHFGQYLPDWHPWESIKNFYVSRKSTGAVKELIPFELNWIVSAFGYPQVINSMKRKISNLDTNIDDIYNFNLKFKNNLILNFTIEVLARPKAIRNIDLISDKGRISYNHDDQIFNIYSLKNTKSFKIKKTKTLKNYINPEKPYIEEIQDFIKAIKNNKFKFPHNISEDIKLLKILKNIDEKAK